MAKFKFTGYKTIKRVKDKEGEVVEKEVDVDSITIRGETFKKGEATEVTGDLAKKLENMDVFDKVDK